MLLLLFAVAIALPVGGAAEQASQPTSPAAGLLDLGMNEACAVLRGGSVRCWGYGGDGELGYGNTDSVGDDETPASVGPVDLGGQTAKAISAGAFHTCALLDTGSVLCWGYGADGRLGYGNTSNVGDQQTPSAVGPVDLGGHLATAITAGGAHTCAILDDGSVRCWGHGGFGELGYPNTGSIGDSQTAAAAPPVDLGQGRTAKAITAGDAHTCALLDNAKVLCWGLGADGRLGYGNTSTVGRTDTPGSVGPVNLGPGYRATAISAGGEHTCALLDDGTVHCWGYGGYGELGYGNTNNVGDDETPATAGAVNLGVGRKAVAISAGQNHTCALLDSGTVLCWGLGADGRLGYGNTNNVGDQQTPGSVGPVDLGGLPAMAISAGGRQTCARLDNGSVVCWGYGANGRLGYCNESNVGDAQTPDALGPINLQPGDGGAQCASPPPGGPPPSGHPPGRRPPVDSEAARARGYRTCLAKLATRSQHQWALTHRGSAHHRAQARRRLARELSSGRRRCVKIYGLTPGRVTGLQALTRGSTKIELDFNAPGTNATHPPPARSYLIEQSLHPIRSERDFSHASALCNGACRFNVARVGAKIALTITRLKPDTTYYYAVAARDKITATLGPRSHTVKGTTR